MNSSRKGSSFERTVCRQLSLWVSDGKRDDIFWRTAGSGARATSRAKTGKTTQNSAGDISYLSAEGMPLIKFITWELKKGYNKATIDQLSNMVIKPDSGKKQENLVSFFRQAMRSAQEAGTPHWIVLHKPDNRVAMCYMDGELYDFLVLRNPHFSYMFSVGARVGFNGEMMQIGALKFDEILQMDYAIIALGSVIERL